MRMIFRTRDNESLENLQISISKTTYIKLYLQNSISTAFYYTMEGPTISGNILFLSTDIENLGGLGQQSPMISNTENGWFKYLKYYSVLYKIITSICFK